MSNIIQIIVDHKVQIITVLFVLSELLAMIPGFKSNSVVQLVVNWVKTLHDKFVPPADK